MRFAVAFVATFAVLMVLPGSATFARPAAGASVSTVADGLRLTLTTGRRTYPLDALVRVTVRAQNVSDHAITLAGTAGLPNGGNPSIFEVDAAGQTVYSPSKFIGTPLFPWAPTPPREIQLLPGEAIRRTSFVILWSSFLQAAVFITAPESDVPRSDSLALHLVGARAPHLDLHTSGGQVYVLVHRPKGTKGPLFYRSSVRCENSGGWTIREQPNLARERDVWGKTETLRLVPPPCPTLPAPQTPVPSTLTAWWLIVGWPNHSVATISYGTSAA